MYSSNETHSISGGDSRFSSFRLYPWAWSIVALFVTIAWTRVYSSILGPSKSKTGANYVPTIPYWTPFIGHALQLGIWPDRLLQSMRSAFPHGISSLVLLGSTHNLIWSPSLIQAVFSQRSIVVDYSFIVWYILVNVGGVPKSSRTHYEKALSELHSAITSNLSRDPNLSKMLGIAVGNIQEQLPSLVTFSEHFIDQLQWERVSNAMLIRTEDGPAVEIDLLSLLLNFTGSCSIPSIFGTDFHRNYPDLLSDVWKFNHGFLHLAAGLPRWVPIPKLATAYAARSRLVKAIQTFHEAHDAQLEGRDPGIDWQNLDDVSQMLKDRQLIYRKHDIPPRMRGPVDLSILWALNANMNFLVFWMLARILSDDALTARIRAETAPFVIFEKPNQDFGKNVYEVPRIKILDKDIAARCPLLKSCYIESLRLDSAPWSVKKVLQDFTITESPNDYLKRGDREPQSYHIKAGTFTEVPFDLHFTDPRYFTDPNTFIPDRHIVQREKSGILSSEAEFGTVRPYGGGQTMCKGRLYAEREVYALIAGILALWNIEPADKMGWKLPGHRKATAVNMPKSDIRVRIRRRV